MLCTIIDKITGRKRPTIEVFQGIDGLWRTRIRATNGEIVYQDEAFASESNAWRKARVFSAQSGLKVKE